MGQADERLPERGITHLIEHLALAGTQMSVNHNGQTDLHTTTFTVSGSWDEIDAHLAHVADSLTRLPVARLDVEKQILQTEEDGRGQGVVERLAAYRYGASGIGLTAYPEWGLERIDPPALQQWVQRYFTADNAVLVVVGPQRPEHLSWSLPAGAAVPIPEPARLPLAMPGFAFEGVPGPAMLAELPRTTAATAYARILDRELMRVVRADRGLAYRAGAGYLPLSAEAAVVVAQTDSVTGKEQQAVDAFLDVLYALAMDGPSQQVLDEVVVAATESFDEPSALFGRTHSAATDLLLGRPMPDRSALAAEYAALTPRDIRQVAADVVRTATVLLPPQARALGRGGFTRIRATDTQQVQGQRFRVPTESGDVPVELIIGVEGVSRVRGDDTLTIRYTDLAALLRRSDGRRVLVAKSGDSITLDPAVVGSARTDLVDVAAGAERWIDVTVAPAAAAPTPQAAAPSPTPAPAPAVTPVAPIAPLTTFQRFVVRPLRAVGVALAVMVLFGMLWPMRPDDTMVPPGDLLFFLLPLVAATADNILYARRARLKNHAEAAYHQSTNSARTEGQHDETGVAA